MLAVITYRRIKDHLRVVVRERERGSGVDLDTLPDGRPSADEQLEDAELVHAVRVVLDRMTPLDRWLLEQHEVWDMTAEEMAEALGYTPGGVRTRLMRARERFLDLATRVLKLDLGGLL